MERRQRPVKHMKPVGETVTLPTGHKVPIDAIKQLDLQGTPREKRLIEKLPTLSGSIAGANSRFLQDYERHRERELRRIAGMEKEAQKEAEAVEFAEHKESRKRAIEDEAAKKRERRLRRKQGKSVPDQPAIPGHIMEQIIHHESVERSSKSLPVASRPAQTSHPYSVSSSALRLVEEEF